MAAAIEQVSLLCGHDIRGGVLIAHGGAGGQFHAAWPNPWGWGGAASLRWGALGLGIGQAQERRWQQRAGVNPSAPSCSRSCSTGLSCSRAAAGPSGA